VKDIQIKEKAQLKSNMIRENVNPWLNIGSSAHYTIEGSPIPLKRPRFGVDHVYDSQKREKMGASLQLKSQHEYTMPFEGPLKVEITFFMPIPLRRAKKDQIACYMPHHIKPDLDNLIKFVLDCANGIIICDDALVSSIVANKIYSRIARTELSITRLEPNGESESTKKKN
jgi:Holliday junction resolvase RusA-like endonuclease